MGGFRVIMLVILLALFALAFSRVDFVLHYEGTCQGTGPRTCKAKSSSTEVKTHINGNGEVTETHKKLIGSVSHLTEFVLNPNSAGEFQSVGNITFGVHSTHHLHLLTFTSQGQVLFQGRHGRTEAGLFNVTSGKGELAGAHGAGSYTCHSNDGKRERFSCWFIGLVHTP